MSSMMKTSDAVVAIHHRPGGFSDRWIEQCEERGVSHKIVNCYDHNIIRELGSTAALMWHWTHYFHADLLIARHVISAAEGMGLKVFPASRTCWHFDDKIAQKYLLEAMGAPLVATYVFVAPDQALNWVETMDFPKVFKLRRGAGSANVFLVRNRKDAVKLIRQAFGIGFKPVPKALSILKQKASKMWSGKYVLDQMRRLPTALLNRRLMAREKGYAYFQDFLPDNKFDTRVTVIGNRAFAFTRDVRPNDFRASGSGLLNYDRCRIDMKCVEIAISLANKIGSQSTAFDFLKDSTGSPKIAEISYCYDAKAVHDCDGFWDERLDWHPGHVWPQDAILEDLLKEIVR